MLRNGTIDGRKLIMLEDIRNSNSVTIVISNKSFIPFDMKLPMIESTMHSTVIL